jgi:hypothetical protein
MDLAEIRLILKGEAGRFSANFACPLAVRAL